MTRFRLWLIFVLLPCAMLLSGCQTVSRFLPPQHCMPSADLPAHKSVKPLPEIETGNDELYLQFAHERKEHAQDDQDYNSLYGLCVGGEDARSK